jgi:glycosyltransferase involved in cell wall biosynthesis
MSAADHRIRVVDNPQQRTTFGLNIGLENARGDYVVRMDAHTSIRRVRRQGHQRLQRATGWWVRAPDPARHRPWSRRVAIALMSWLGAAAPPSGRRREKDIDTGVFTGVWSAPRSTSTAAGTTAGPSARTELAARFFERGSRIVCMPELGCAVRAATR